MRFEMADKKRPLVIFRYLWNHTDEEHPATIKDIIAFLETEHVVANRHTVAKDISELQESGFDIICVRSRQNKYFIGDRGIEIAELKSIVDAILAAKFISPAKTKSLIDRITAIASPYHADELKRSLYVEGKVKTSNEAVYYTVDILQKAINEESVVTFQYIEYTPDKKRMLKHNGQKYKFSPYDLVWDDEAYYVFGWSKGNNHNKIVKFRVDRIVNPRIVNMKFYPKPDDYDISVICKRVFSMYDGETETVELKCTNDIMKDIVDRFGEDVETRIVDSEHFVAKVEVSVSRTFFAWVFAYAGKIQLIYPDKVKNDFKSLMSQSFLTD